MGNSSLERPLLASTTSPANHALRRSTAFKDSEKYFSVSPAARAASNLLCDVKFTKELIYPCYLIDMYEYYQAFQEYKLRNRLVVPFASTIRTQVFTAVMSFHEVTYNLPHENPFVFCEYSDEYALQLLMENLLPRSRQEYLLNMLQLVSRFPSITQPPDTINGFTWFTTLSQFITLFNGLLSWNDLCASEFWLPLFRSSTVGGGRNFQPDSLLAVFKCCFPVSLGDVLHDLYFARHDEVFDVFSYTAAERMVEWSEYTRLS